MIKIFISLTIEDVANFSYANWRASFNKQGRKNFLINTAVSGIIGCFAGIALVSLFTGKRVDSSFIFIVPVIALAIVLFYWISIRSRFATATRRMYSLRENHNALLRNEITFSNEGIETISHNDWMKYKWTSIVRVLENDKYYFLYTNSVLAHIIPKKEIPVDLAAEFKQLLTDNIPAQYYFTQKH
jgi:hypothetical protein